MRNVRYVCNGGSWETDAGKFFWPVEGDMHFYAYAPAAPCAEGEFTIDSGKQQIVDFVPCATAAAQKDFIYAYAKGNLTDNGSSGMDVDFKHALTEVSIAAKNENPAYTVEVTGVKLGNIKSKGTFTFPSVDGSPASWKLSSNGSDVTDYATTWANAYRLVSNASSLDASNVAFMLLPQKLEKSDLPSCRAYIAMRVIITMQDGKHVCNNDWVYVGIDTNWKMGKHYTYTLDFTSGAGQDVNGNDILPGEGIKVGVCAIPWIDKGEASSENVLPKLPATANCLILDPAGDKVGKINVANNINIFWSNPDVGDAANVIDKKSDWIAEVIWQDIDSRAINFCDAAGNAVPGDSFKGTADQPLYIKAVGGMKGNVLLGVKKKGTGNDAYLWSWHLWITDEPQLVDGFMDRNLGATSATPSDRIKTHGLYYQFGRKDPFTGDINRYDINGLPIGKTTVTSGKVTFAKAVQTPGVFYTYGSGNYDWASPNNYVTVKWNDITDADGKSLFDPSPEGWRLPDKKEYSIFSSANFTWDSNNNGRTYKANWFPAAGYYNSNGGGMGNVYGFGCYWSCSPDNADYGYQLFFSNAYMTPFSFYNRADGHCVRCVQE